jgi:hypothetical protein
LQVRTTLQAVSDNRKSDFLPRLFKIAREWRENNKAEAEADFKADAAEDKAAVVGEEEVPTKGLLSLLTNNRKKYLPRTRKENHRQPPTLL